METVAIKGDKRDVSIKTSEIRKQGKIPAVIYGADVLEHCTVTKNEVKHLIYTPEFKTGDLSIDGKTFKCIIKDIQWHPVTDEIRHIDFLAIKDGVKVKVEIPVRFKGDSPGVKEGGKLMQSMRKVKVKLDPKDLVDALYVDISELKLGDAVRVKDLEVADNIEVMVNAATPLAIVEVPRALKSTTAEEEKAQLEAEAAAAEATPAEE